MRGKTKMKKGSERCKMKDKKETGDINILYQF